MYMDIKLNLSMIWSHNMDFARSLVIWWDQIWASFSPGSTEVIKDPHETAWINQIHILVRKLPACRCSCINKCRSEHIVCWFSCMEHSTPSLHGVCVQWFHFYCFIAMLDKTTICAAAELLNKIEEGSLIKAILEHKSHYCCSVMINVNGNSLL